MKFAVAVMRGQSVAGGRTFLEEQQDLPRSGCHRASPVAEIADDLETKYSLVKLYRSGHIFDV
jgi:hypothetical protein